MFSNARLIVKALSSRERVAATVAVVVVVLASLSRLALTVRENSTFVPIAGGSYVEGIVGQPRSVNPIVSGNQADRDIAALLFSPLAELISSFETEKSKRVYLVKLKDGLLWDDGQPLTSDDVIFTIRLIQNPDARSPLQKSWQGIQAERESELQIRFTLPAPFSFFGENMKRLAPIPRHLFGTVPPENLHLSLYNLRPVGSGPYRFADFEARPDGFITRYRLIPNDRYHGVEPFLDEFIFQFYEQEGQLVNAFRAREVDGFGTLLAPPEAVARTPQAVIDLLPMPRSYTLFMNSLNNPSLKDPDLRKALALSIDRTRIASEVFAGAAVPIGSPIFFDLATLEPTATTTVEALRENLFKTGVRFSTSTAAPPVFDLNAAREKLASSKEEGATLNLVVPKVPFLEQVAVIIRESWNTIGLMNVNLISVEPDDLANEIVKTRNYEILLFGNILQDPADLFSFWHSSQRFHPGLNLALYQNTRADAAIEAIRQLTQATDRAVELKKLEKLILADTLVIPLVSLPYFYVHSERLQGFEPRIVVTPHDRFIDVARWYVAEARVLQ
ncbi:MAG: ABC transporter substrate-binding protein [Patescibacteria group bacterium]